MQQANLRGVVSWVICVGAMLGAFGCSRDKPAPEATFQVAEALGGTDSGAANAGAIVPSACVVAVQGLQISDRSMVQADIAGGTVTLGTDSKYTGNAFSAGNVAVGARTSITGTLTYGGTLTDDATVTIGTARKATVARPTIATQTFTVGTTALTVANGATKRLRPAPTPP